jgi:GTP-dependent phosphoenolpyruvate carboxykinase
MHEDCVGRACAWLRWLGNGDLAAVNKAKGMLLVLTGIIYSELPLKNCDVIETRDALQNLHMTLVPL